MNQVESIVVPVNIPFILQLKLINHLLGEIVDRLHLEDDDSCIDHYKLAMVRKVPIIELSLVCKRWFKSIQNSIQTCCLIFTNVEGYVLFYGKIPLPSTHFTLQYSLMRLENIRTLFFSAKFIESPIIKEDELRKLTSLETIYLEVHSPRTLEGIYEYFRTSQCKIIASILFNYEHGRYKEIENLVLQYLREDTQRFKVRGMKIENDFPNFPKNRRNFIETVKPEHFHLEISFAIWYKHGQFITPTLKSLTIDGGYTDFTYLTCALRSPSLQHLRVVFPDHQFEVPGVHLFDPGEYNIEDEEDNLLTDELEYEAYQDSKKMCPILTMRLFKSENTYQLDLKEFFAVLLNNNTLKSLVLLQFCKNYRQHDKIPPNFQLATGFSEFIRINNTLKKLTIESVNFLSIDFIKNIETNTSLRVLELGESLCRSQDPVALMKQLIRSLKYNKSIEAIEFVTPSYPEVTSELPSILIDNHVLKSITTRLANFRPMSIRHIKVDQYEDLIQNFHTVFDRYTHADGSRCDDRVIHLTLLLSRMYYSNVFKKIKRTNENCKIIFKPFDEPYYET